MQLKIGGITHLRLNKDGKPIANKYRKGKMKRTLKRESKELEAVEMDAVGHKAWRRAAAGGEGCLSKVRVSGHGGSTLMKRGALGGGTDTARRRLWECWV